MGESFLAFSLDEIVNDVAIHEYFFSRYNEAPIAKEDREKTTIITEWDLMHTKSRHLGKGMHL
jgi:hypothetical protein